jgi:hypothetical protein
MDELDRLLSLEAIRGLALRYALAVDGKDLDTLATLFAPDVDNGRHGTGPDGVRRFFDQSLRKFHSSMHLVANHVIDLDDDDDDDHAGGVVYCLAQHHVLEPDHWFDEALAYWDSYERIEGEWRFRRRRVRSWYRQHIGHPEHGTGRTVPDVETSGPKRGGRLPEAFATFEAFWSRTDPL